MIIRLIECACGCGKQLTNRDNWYKHRKFINGHNPDFKKWHISTLITKNCEVCNKEFKVRPSILKIGKGKTCSIKCGRLYVSIIKGIERRRKLWKDYVTPIHKRIRESESYKDWRKSVFERDDYVCQLCNKRGGDLQADHIKPFSLESSLRFELNNGRTLCVDCHKKTETYGYNARYV